MARWGARCQWWPQQKRLIIDCSQTINRYALPDAYPLTKIDDLIDKSAEGRDFSTLDSQHITLHEKDEEFIVFQAFRKLFRYRRLPFGVTNDVSVF